MVLLAQVALTPAGNPIAAPMPLAPVVVWVIFVNKVLIQSEGVEDATLTVQLNGTTSPVESIIAPGA